MSAKATRDPKAGMFQGLRAKIAPVSASISVVDERERGGARRPSTHST
jgi:hypothetical protein